MSESVLSAVVQRLEAAAQRLEDIVARTKSSDSGAASSSTAAVSNGSSAPFVTAFDDVVSESLKPFIDASVKIGGLVKEQSDLFVSAVQAQRQFLVIASQAKKPDQATLTSLLQPTQSNIVKVNEIRDKNRSSPFFNHLSMVSEGIPALGWVCVEPTPAPFCGDMKDSAQFYSNRVIKEFKEKDQTNVEWAQAFIKFLNDLQQYIRKNHTTGVTWNAKGAEAKTFVGAATPAPAAATPAPAATSAPVPTQSPVANLLGELSGATSGLKKVDKSQMTHKNPELRGSSIVKADAIQPKAAAPKFGAAAKPAAPPKLALEGNKWVVENFNGNNEIVIDKAELKHTVYIYNVQNSTILIKGKVNAVSVDNCKKVGVVVENIVSTVDVVNCKSSQLQVTGKLPTIAVDKTDGFQIYLSKESKDAEILTAKCSEMNILIQQDDGEYDEKPVAEQFKTKIVNGKLVTVAVEHSG